MTLTMVLGMVCGIAAIWQTASVYFRKTGSKLSTKTTLAAGIIYAVLLMLTASNARGYIVPLVVIVALAVIEFINYGPKETQHAVVLAGAPFAVLLILRAARRLGTPLGKITFIIALIPIIALLAFSVIEPGQKIALKKRLSPYGGNGSSKRPPRNKNKSEDQPEDEPAPRRKVGRGMSLPDFKEMTRGGGFSPSAAMLAIGAVVLVVLVII